MSSPALCGRLSPSAPARAASLSGLSARSSLPAARLRATIIVAGGGEVLPRGSWGAPARSRLQAVGFGVVARTHQHAEDWVSLQGLRGAYRKRWVVQSSNSEQGKGISEEKKIQSLEGNSGPPVLTIVAGLLVLFVVFWALGSLGSWLGGLLFKP